jgi:predicted phage terminase large subunit-like protein
MFKREWLERNVVRSVPAGCDYCRHWDFAATQDGGDYTAGALLARDDAGVYYVVDVRRGQWSPGESDRQVLATAALDRERHGDVKVRGEEEPGSAGKKASAAFVRLLAGYDVDVVRATGSKETRARALASQCEYDNVKLVYGAWVEDFVSELERFPRGKHDDQVDASAGAFNKLALAPSSDALPLVDGSRDSFLGGW